MKYTVSSILLLLLSIALVISCKDSGFTNKANKFVNDSTKTDSQYDDDDDDDSDTDDDSSGESESGEDSYDLDGDGTISKEEYEKLTQGSDSDSDDDDDDDDDDTENPFGPMSATLHRGEGSCSGCKAIITLELVKIGNKKLSSKAKEQATTKITLDAYGNRAGVSGSSNICPTKNVVARYEMSISYQGNTVPSTDRKILLGARDPDEKNRMYIGIADVAESNYAFHNVDTLIGSVSCPNAKRIAIKNLCRDQVLEANKTLIKCWMTTTIDSSCPKSNWYGKNDYPAQCKEETW